MKEIMYGYTHLVKVCPDVNGKNDEHKSGHTSESTGASSVTLSIEYETHADSAKYLGCPVDHTVKRSTPKGEECTIEVVEF